MGENMKATTAYKLFRKRKDGTLGPLFIGASQRITIGEWMEAEDIPTKGFAHRPGWHAGLVPETHIQENDNRVWCECLIKDYYPFQLNSKQKEWQIAKWLKVVKELTAEEVLALRQQEAEAA
jgi:hypothetical protein